MEVDLTQDCSTFPLTIRQTRLKSDVRRPWQESNTSATICTILPACLKKGQNYSERVLGIEELNIKIKKWRKECWHRPGLHRSHHWKIIQFSNAIRLSHNSDSALFRWPLFLFGRYFSWLHNDENTWHKLIDNVHQAGKGQKTKGAQRNAGKWWRMHHGRLPWRVDWGKEGGGGVSWGPNSRQWVLTIIAGLHHWI